MFIYLTQQNKKLKRYIEIIIDAILEDFTSRERRDVVYLTKDAADICIKTDHTISDSFAEGLVNYDDIDWIKSIYYYLIVDSERSAEITNKVLHTGSKSVVDTGILIIDTEDCNPGFVRLLVYKEQHRSSFRDFSFHNGKKYFNGKMFMGHHAPEKLTVKGPSLAAIGDGSHIADYVLCLPFTGPINERVLLPCNFFSGKDDLCFVSKSHEYSKYPDIDIRWSFSNFENHIIRQFTDIEFQLYFIRKELYNTYIKSNDEDKTCISSYTIKTLMFYFREKHREEMKSESMINLIKLFLCDMKSSLKEKYLPQYFIREYNMFDVLKDDEAKEFLLIIENIEKDLVLAILSCKFFGNFDSLITLCTIYETVTKINDFNMKDNILKKIYEEKTFKHEKEYLDGYSYGQKRYLSIKDHLDAQMYDAALHKFTSQFTYENYWVLLCLYFHCNTIFKTYYRAQVIENFKFLFERNLASYLMGIVPKNHQRHLMYLLIEALLHRLIYLPNPIPLLHVNDKIPLAFYYFLRKDKEKTSNILINLTISYQTFGWDYLWYQTHSIIPIGQFYPNSIFSNDVILTKYMKRNFATPALITASTYIIEFTPVFLMNYMTIQDMARSLSKEATKKALNKIESFNQHELGLLAVLEENLDLDID